MKRISKDRYYLEIAMKVASRSTCLKRQYGCVIVKDDEIIATGYNGSSRGTVNCCDVYDVCPRANKAHNSGDYSDCASVHAEQNAMLSAARRDLIGATLYLAGTETQADGTRKAIAVCEPCPICARMISNAGINKVIGPQDLPADETKPNVFGAFLRKPVGIGLSRRETLLLADLMSDEIADMIPVFVHHDDQAAYGFIARSIAEMTSFDLTDLNDTIRRILSGQIPADDNGVYDLVIQNNHFPIWVGRPAPGEVLA